MPWLPWILLFAGLGVAGLAVLAVLAMRVFAAVRELGNEVERSQQQLEPKLAALEHASEQCADQRGGGSAARPTGSARETSGDLRATHTPERVNKVAR